MDWENKIEMVRLGNSNTDSPEAMKAFQDFTLKHMTEFDGQAWDMFAELIVINPDGMKKEIDYWKEVYNLLKDVDCNDEQFGFRTGMRIAMIQTICVDELKLNNVE
jgi:hypothetical protein